MPRKSKIPSYCHHKASGRAVVRIDGHDHYLGPYGSDESHAEYSRLIAEWRTTRQESLVKAANLTRIADPSLTVSEVLLSYKSFAHSYYSRDGKPTQEYAEMGLALRPVRELYGTTPAREFGPLKLQAVRQRMIDSGLSRGVINNRLHRIRRAFKWAVAEELVSPLIYEGLRAVAGLKKGRTSARETEPIRPVADEHIDAILPYASPQVAAMIQLQRLTGMRPCEVLLMRPCDIDMRADVWIYKPSDHKNAWRGHNRQIALGPKAQGLISPFLNRDSQSHLFSPQEAEAHRNTMRRKKRKTPMTPSQRKRKPKRKPGRAKRDRYGVDTYRRAITYAVRKANKIRVKEGLPEVPNWFPLQLRHSRATELNEMFGIEAAAVSLGHAHADVTKVYAERNLKKAIEVARQTG